MTRFSIIQELRKYDRHCLLLHYELQALGDIPSNLQNYIDYEAFGRDLSLREHLLILAEECVKYHTRAGRSATESVASDSLFLFGDSKKAVPFPLKERS